MNVAAQRVTGAYADALRAFLQGAGEAALERGYAVGRRALREGLGVLDIASIHTQAMAALVAELSAPAAELTERGAQFLREALSPFEMTHRGFQEANATLQLLNQTLEQRVLERTAQAEAARAAAAAAERRWRLLADASKLLETSLDYRTRLRNLARFAVPVLADWCVVDMLEEDGTIQRLEVAHLDAAKEELVRELRRRYPPDPAGTNPVLTAIRTGEASLMPELTEADLGAAARDARHLEILRSLGLRSAMVVPLNARGRTLGAITLVASESGRRFGPEDLRFAQELASRVALAVDNVRLYEAAQQASQAKSDFLAVISHELRTPLNAIIGYTDLLLVDVPAPVPPKAKEALQRVRVSALHLLELIEEILTFSRVEAGREGLRVEEVDAAEIARSAALLLEPTANGKGLSLQVRVPQQRLPMSTDIGKVRQILVNVLSNAVKFTDHGEVELEVREQQPGWVTFRVRDTGLGIAPEHLEKIFDPFWQVEQSATRRLQGTGLGLTVARRLAHLLGGDVTAASTPGRGSTFTVELPARVASEQAAA